MAEIQVERVGTARDATHTAPLGAGLARPRISWGAIFAGLVVATVLQVVLSLLGVAIGLAALDPNSSAKSFGIGTGIWALLTALISMFVAGSTTGRLAGVLERRDGFLHGVVLWGLSTLLAVWLISRGLGALFGGALNLTGNLLGGATRAVGAATSAAVGAATSGNNDVNLDFADVRRELERTLRQTGDPSLRPESLAKAGRSAEKTATRSGADNEAAIREIGDLVQQRAGNVDRNDVLNVITARTDLSRAEAERLADRVTQGAQDIRGRASQVVAQVKAEAPEKIENAATATSGATWLALLALGLTLASAAYGATRTAPR